MTGIYLYNDLYFAKSDEDTVHFIDVSRCNLGHVALGHYFSRRNSGSSNLRFSENVIRGNVNGADVQFCLFEKNIISTQISYFNGNCTFRNNIFTHYASYQNVFSHSSGLIVNNNIFTRDNHGLEGSQINNNIFSINIDGQPGGTNIGDGNIGSQSASSVFVDFDGIAFNYSADLHLMNGSPGINGGTDGNHIGIYGTDKPYKPSAVPHNPHIRSVEIPDESEDGFLPVQISVGTQEN